MQYDQKLLDKTLFKV